MTKFLYDSGRQALSDGGSINWASHTIKAVLIDTAAYTASQSAHSNLSDIPSGARIATSAAFSGKTNVAGVFSAAPFTFTAVTGVSCEAIAVYQDTGFASTSRLIFYTDEAVGPSGFPITPNGSDITISPDTGPNKLFKI